MPSNNDLRSEMPDSALSDILRDLTTALLDASASLNAASALRPSSADLPIAYTIPSMSVEVQMYFKKTTSGITGFFKTAGSENSLSSTVKLEMVAVPRSTVGPIGRYALTDPQTTGPEIRYIQELLLNWFTAETNPNDPLRKQAFLTALDMKEPVTDAALRTRFIDGHFGNDTDKVVKAFQKINGLTSNGEANGVFDQTVLDKIKAMPPA